MNSMNFFVFLTLILVFTILNKKFLLKRESFINVSNSSMVMAKLFLKQNLFSGKKCLTKKELKQNINKSIDTYFPMYSTLSGKKTLCVDDLEAYIKDV